MFRLMLNAHPRLSVPTETWFLSEMMDQLPLTGPLTPVQVETAVSIVQNHWRWKEWGLDDALLRSAVQTLDEPGLADVIDALFSLTVEGTSAARWGDKTPGYTTEIERLHRVFPEAQFIQIIRDGRDVCMSLKKTGWHGESSWNLADYWATTVKVGCEAGRALSSDLYLEVAYEDLVLDTEATLRAVCRFLDVEFAAEMLDFHETAGDNIPGRARGHLSKTLRPPRESDVQRWRREQARHQTVIFEAFAGPVLELAGYERTVRPGLLWAVRAACRSVERLAVASLPVRRRLGLHFPGWRKAL